MSHSVNHAAAQERQLEHQAAGISLRIAAVSAFKRQHGRSPTLDELDLLLPPVACARTRALRRRSKSARGSAPTEAADA